MKHIIKILTIIAIISILLISSCTSNTATQDSELSDIDKEIEALQQELLKQRESSDKDMEETKTIAESTPKIDVKEPTNENVDKKLTVKETDLVNLKLTTLDEDKDRLTYIFSKPLDTNGKWQTTYGDEGEYIITITASDGKLKTEKRLLLIVQKKNVAPVIKPIVDIVATEGDTIRIKAEVSDINRDEIKVTYTLPIDSNGVWVTDYTSAGTYKITVKASDGILESSEELSITVEDKNALPVIENVEDIVIDEGETVRIEPKVSDLDKDKVITTISEPVGNDGIWQTNYSDHGTYSITVNANDGKGTSFKTVKITVRDINRPPQILDISLEKITHFTEENEKQNIIYHYFIFSFNYSNFSIS